MIHSLFRVRGTYVSFFNEVGDLLCKTCFVFLLQGVNNQRAETIWDTIRRVSGGLNSSVAEVSVK